MPTPRLRYKTSPIAGASRFCIEPAAEVQSQPVSLHRFAFCTAAGGPTSFVQKSRVLRPTCHAQPYKTSGLPFDARYKTVPSFVTFCTLRCHTAPHDRQRIVGRWQAIRYQFIQLSMSETCAMAHVHITTYTILLSTSILGHRAMLSTGNAGL